MAENVRWVRPPRVRKFSRPGSHAADPAWASACTCVWCRSMLCSLRTACWPWCELLLQLLLFFLLKVLLFQQPPSSPSTLCLSGRNPTCSHEWRAYFTKRHHVLFDHSSQRVKVRERTHQIWDLNVALILQSLILVLWLIEMTSALICWKCFAKFKFLMGVRFAMLPQ